MERSNRLGRQRWVVERTMAWLNGVRRLHRRYERKAELPGLSASPQPSSASANSPNEMASYYTHTWPPERLSGVGAGRFSNAALARCCMALLGGPSFQAPTVPCQHHASSCDRHGYGQRRRENHNPARVQLRGHPACILAGRLRRE
ncbi:transposase [Actinomadura sp. HBU206391]|nr:transposase [Actinomadura sp. HBU206391]